MGGTGPEQPHNYMPAYFICPTPEEKLVKETVPESQAEANQVEVSTPALYHQHQQGKGPAEGSIPASTPAWGCPHLSIQPGQVHMLRALQVLGPIRQTLLQVVQPPLGCQHHSWLKHIPGTFL